MTTAYSVFVAVLSFMCCATNFSRTALNWLLFAWISAPLPGVLFDKGHSFLSGHFCIGSGRASVFSFGGSKVIRPGHVQQIPACVLVIGRRFPRGALNNSPRCRCQRGNDGFLNRLTRHTHSALHAVRWVGLVQLWTEPRDLHVL